MLKSRARPVVFVALLIGPLLVGSPSAGQAFGQSRDEVVGKMKPFAGESAAGVDVATLTGKVMCGYQGWFAAEGDGSGRGWVHYGRGGRFEPGRAAIDLWPDMSEFGDDEKFATGFRHADGSVAHVFSSQNAKTVDRHFRWMKDYGIDGVFVQRFAVETFGAKNLEHCNTVLAHCRDGANRHGRAYAVMYDLSGVGRDQIDRVIDDWKLLVDRMQIALGEKDGSKDKAYLRHHGKPVVAVWGLGFNDGRRYTLADCEKFVRFLKDDPKYGGTTVMLGVPTNWRTLDGDCLKDEQFHDIIRAADIVSPWTIGRYISPRTAAEHSERRAKPDMAWCRENGKEYLPVVFPGFSWHNLKRNAPLDQIPRLKGEFLWRQYTEAKKLGATMVYQAMFDEVDEGTAIFKCTNDPPASESKFLSYEGLPTDHYLWLTGMGGKLVRGDIAATDALPVRADKPEGKTGEKPAGERKLASGGRERTYHVYVPAKLDRSKPAPLLMVFHGAGGDGQGEMSSYRKLADQHRFLLVGPDGINKRWNAGCDDEIKATDNADDVTFVRDLVAAIRSEFNVDAERVYAAGFSNGAALCHRLAAEMPDVLAAIAGAGATMAKVTQPQLKTGSGISVMVMVGTEDEMFGRNGNLRGGTFLTADETARTWAKQNGNAEAVTRDKPVPIQHWPATAPATADVELWIVEGAGHTPDMSKAFHTASEQWRFLAGKRREARYTAWPFDAAEAKRRQEETATATKLPVELKTRLSDESETSITWRLIPPGAYMIGSPENEDGHEGDERMRSATIAEPFYMMETQLTVEQYRALLKADPSDSGKDGDAKAPAGIYYRDTVDKVLPALAKHAPEGWKVILPDHVRLEYAARAGIATMNPGGNLPEQADAFAWSRENSKGKVHAVAQKTPNAWGLHDVIGNRWHWFWRAGDGYGDASTEDHIVYGGSHNSESGGNGVRLANIMISKHPEGARFALIRANSAAPLGHPETKQ